MVLWTLFLLAALAAAVAAYVGGQIEVARRCSGQISSRQAALAGVNHGLSLLIQETNGWEALSERWASDPEEFNDVSSGVRVAWTAFYHVKRSDGAMVTNYGFCDEGGRIDINFAREDVLASLFRLVGGIGEGRAKEIAKDIVNSRVQTPQGQGSTPMSRSAWKRPDLKNGPFLSVYELLWIEGMSRDTFNRILPYITVYGGTRININTADPEVLRVLFAAKGYNGGGVIRKILQFRERGGIFRTLSGGGALAETGERLDLPADEQGAFSGLASLATVTSDRFRGYVVAGRGASQVGISFVWDRRARRFLYWHED